MSHLLRTSELFDPLADRLDAGMPVFGTCAGMIMCATSVLDGRPDQRSFGRIDLAVRRNGYGRQYHSGTFALSSGYYDAYYGRAQKVRAAIRAEMEKAFEGVDLMLTPTTPTVAFELGAKVDDPLEMYMNDILTVSANLAGTPAITLTGPDGAAQTFDESVRLLQRAEFEALYAASGLVVEGVYGDYDGRPHTERSPRLVLLARRA